MSDKKEKYIYLDHAAGTPLDPEVATLMSSFENLYENPSSIHKKGRHAKQTVNDAKIKIGNILEANPEEIIFTGSGTESDNLAVLGIARANKEFGKHIIISAIEHKAVTESVKHLKKEGFELTIIPVKRDGTIYTEKCVEAIRPDTILVSVIYANNEIGTIQPIEELSQEICKFKKEKSFPLLHTDACQTPGLLPISVKKLGVDLMTLNSSKCYGPKGVGLLYKKNGIKIQPLIFGGSQEFGTRPGTENTTAIIGFAKALETAEEKRSEESKRLKKLQTEFIESILKSVPGSILNGSTTNRLPNNVHISIPNIEGESVLLLLEEEGIAVSTGSACSSFNLEPSHVLRAIGQNDELIHGSLRFSFGRSTTKKDLDYTLDKLIKITERLSSLSALTTKAYENHL